MLRGIDLAIRQCQATVLIGPSGCGKSTFLRCLNGLEMMDGGEIRIGASVLNREKFPDFRSFDCEARHLRREVGMVFQSFNLFPHLTALENVMKAPVVVKGMAREEAEPMARGFLKKVGLEEHADHYPSQMSGGQQQRAAIARALAMSPKVMLYDEPTSALDPSLVDEVLAVMQQLDQEGMTQVIVTHEMRFARDVADQVVFFYEGEVAERGTPEQIFQNPEDPRTRRFLKKFIES